MKYNPLTKTLFTNDGEILKKLYCPRFKQWEELAQSNVVASRHCDHCEKSVLDTSNLSDLELRRLVDHAPDACLKVDLNQDNITVTYE